MSRKILFAIGFLLLFIPLGLRILDSHHQKKVVSTYWKEIETVTENEIDNCLEEAREYNRKLFHRLEVSETSYEHLLNLAGDGIMGNIEIPRISLKLPIYHGTEEEVLSKGAGHLKGSSLPVGGKNVHSVLAGHSGVPNMQLFTRLDELEKEDVFFIRVCNEVLIYQVCEIKVVRPEAVEVTEIQPERDLISLITCTPYGLNTHRLVVTGERVEKQNMEEISVEEGVNMSKQDLLLVILLLFFLLVAFLKWIFEKKSTVF